MKKHGIVFTDKETQAERITKEGRDGKKTVQRRTRGEEDRQP